jgi:hypothetical protein
MDLYRTKRKLKCALALCFTQNSETYHHWKVFADGTSGACIKFNATELLKAIADQPGIRSGEVKYLTLRKLKRNRLRTNDLPFLKRYAFQHEKEFRVIYESATDKVERLDIDIPLSCIESISLNPWIHPDLYIQIKKALCAIDGCDSVKISRSTLIGNEEWKKFGDGSV